MKETVGHEGVYSPKSLTFGKDLCPIAHEDNLYKIKRRGATGRPARVYPCRVKEGWDAIQINRQRAGIGFLYTARGFRCVISDLAYTLLEGGKAVTSHG